MKRFFLLAAMAIAVSAMSVKAQYKYTWQNPQLPRAERVENLLGC